MAVALRATTNGGNGYGGSSQTFVIPASTVPGDIIIVATFLYNAGSVPNSSLSPFAWTEADRCGASGYGWLQTFYRVAQGADAGATITVTNGSNTNQYVAVAVYSGASGVGPSVNSGRAFNNNPATCPGQSFSGRVFPVYTTGEEHSSGMTGYGSLPGTTFRVSASPLNVGSSMSATIWDEPELTASPSPSRTFTPTDSWYDADVIQTLLYVANVPPNTPTNLTPTAGTATLSTGSVAVSAVVSDPDGGNVFALFRYSTDPNFGSYTDVQGTTVGSGGTSTATLTGLAVNTHYYLRAFANDGQVFSAPASSDFYTDRYPVAPASVTAPSSGQVVDTSVTITYPAGSDPDGSALTYDIDYSRDNGSTWTNIVSSNNATSYSWNTSGIAASNQCFVRVRSRDPQNLLSGYTNSAAFTINHNHPPTAPGSITSPTGGSTVNGPTTITWTAATDPDSDPLTYTIDYSRDNQSTWVNIATGVNALTYAYDFSTVAPSTTSFIRVRATDPSGATGPYATTTAFTISHPVPVAPTLNLPAAGASLDLQSFGTFTWTPDVQYGSSTGFAFRRKLGAGAYEWFNTSTLTWGASEVFNTSSSSSYTFTAGYWVDQATSYVWSVATRSQNGNGAYAADRVVYASAPPAGDVIKTIVRCFAYQTATGVTPNSTSNTGNINSNGTISTIYTAPTNTNVVIRSVQGCMFTSSANTPDAAVTLYYRISGGLWQYFTFSTPHQAVTTFSDSTIYSMAPGEIIEALILPADGVNNPTPATGSMLENFYLEIIAVEST